MDLTNIRRTFRKDGVTPCGWDVDLVRRHKRHRKHFAIKGFPDDDAAFEAAIEWRDSTLGRLPSRKVRYKATNCNNSLGIWGLGMTKKRQRNGKVYEYVNVRWRDKNDQPRNCCVSVLKAGGVDQAIAIAREIRDQKTGSKFL